jgi:hypothetical protein
MHVPYHKRDRHDASILLTSIIPVVNLKDISHIFPISSTIEYQTVEKENNTSDTINKVTDQKGVLVWSNAITYVDIARKES